MNASVMNPVKAGTLFALALAIGAMGIYVGEADDAPGAAVIGLVLMLAAVVLGVKAARNRLPAWATRTALVVGALVAGFAAVLTHATVVAAPLFAQPQDVPSVAAPAPAPRWAAGIDRARQLARAAITDQNLPGLSVAVAVGGQIVWAEGFGWRDVETRTPVTPKTRFNIGTAASVVTAAAVEPLGLTNTGADTAAEWSPEHVGEPEEDFPLFQIVRDVILKPIGIGRAQPLPGERATFFVPTADGNPRRGRRPMAMRDLACCAGSMAFSSTPSDLARFGVATGVSVDGTLAGGLVTSLVTRRDRGVVVVVMSNIAHANTSALAAKVGDTFAR